MSVRLWKYRGHFAGRPGKRWGHLGLLAGWLVLVAPGLAAQEAAESVESFPAEEESPSFSEGAADQAEAASDSGLATSADFVIPKNRSCAYLQQKLNQAHSRWLQDQKAKVVFIVDGASINCSAHPGLAIDEGVTLASARDSLHKGALIYTTRDKKPLINVRGSQVRITGLRIRGPRTDRAGENAPWNIGIQVRSQDVEIDHNELLGWNTAAIQIRDPYRVMRRSDLDRLQIHHNFFHHNQTEGRDGYGVATYDGAYARISENVFDFNRHAIAGDGSLGSGYRAYYNLVLPGGGYHQYGFYTHQFDMHGQNSVYCTAFVCQCSSEDPGWAWALIHHLKCGPAGDYMDIQHNTFQYTQDADFMLRGTPQEKAYVWNNSFTHSRESAALQQTETGLDARDNLFGVDTSNELAACDFDGDGKDDVFQATGRSWYFSSGGKREYIHLRNSGIRLRGLAFGDFDGDGRCDVFAKSQGKWKISRGGTGPWSVISTFDVSGLSFAELRFGDFDGDGRTDVFHADGIHWYVSRGGASDWTGERPWNKSAYTVKDLRFGDFDGNGTTDVFSLASGNWSVSYSGQTGWRKLNARLTSDLTKLVFVDYDGNKRTDVLTCGTKWRISKDGRSEFGTMANVGSIGRCPGEAVWGEFNGLAGADGLYATTDRYFRITNRRVKGLVVHSDYKM